MPFDKHLQAFVKLGIRMQSCIIPIRNPFTVSSSSSDITNIHVIREYIDALILQIKFIVSVSVLSIGGKVRKDNGGGEIRRRGGKEAGKG